MIFEYGRDTCLGAEEPLTQRCIVTGIAGWNSTGLLLPAIKIARLPSELRWLLQFSIAKLDSVEKQTHKWSEKHREGRLSTTKLRWWMSLETAPRSHNSHNPIRGLFSLCHVKVINPPSCKVDEIEHRRTSAETLASSNWQGSQLYLTDKEPTGQSWTICYISILI